MFGIESIILTALEDVNYEMYYEYEDIDVENIGQVVTWNFSTDAKWLTFDLTTAILNGTPTNDDVGKYWINISIDDGMDSDFTNFTLKVIVKINLSDKDCLTKPCLNLKYILNPNAVRGTQYAVLFTKRR